MMSQYGEYNKFQTITVQLMYFRRSFIHLQLVIFITHQNYLKALTYEAEEHRFYI